MSEQVSVGRYILDRLIEKPGITAPELLMGRPAYISAGSVPPQLLEFYSRGVVRRAKTTGPSGRSVYAYWVQDLDKLPTAFSESRRVVGAAAIAIKARTKVKSFVEAATVIADRKARPTEPSVLEYIRAHPGVGSSDIINALDPNERTTYVFGLLKRLETKGLIRYESVIEDATRRRRFYVVDKPTQSRPTEIVSRTITTADLSPEKTTKLVPVKGAPVLRIATSDHTYSMPVPEWREVYSELRNIFG